jgi:UDP-N-acetylglucosamine acyltransferase
MIHPSAIVAAGAEVDATAEVGPLAVIGAHVALGARCVVGPLVHLTGHTRIGADNHFHAGAVIGDAPQDTKYRGEPTRLRIGDRNVFREHATVHRSSREESETVVGSDNYFMAGAHVAHNCVIGDRVILANGVALGGYVTVGDRAFLSGNCLVHQFVRVGTLALMQGGSAISLDLPPFMVARGDNAVCGLNTVGLRRAGLTAPQRLELRRLYHRLFRGQRPWRALLETARAEFPGECARTLLDFLAATSRGVCVEARREGTPAPTVED